MSVALVHDWLTGMRGGERVLEALGERYPEADLSTLLHVPGWVTPSIEQRPIHPSALQYLPGIRHYYRECLPVFPVLVEQFDLERFDLVISSSHCVAKSVLTRFDALHICYCHTPMRYAWDQFGAYFGADRIGWAASRLMRSVMARLARWDCARLERAAGATSPASDVEFLGRVPDDRLRDLYRRAWLTLMTGEEDFGIAPVEAQACGRPVVALARGGALETVIPGETGVLVDELTPSAFADAVAQALEARFDSAAIRRHAEQFGRQRFCKDIAAVIEETAAC